MYSTYKRIIAAILLSSQLLTTTSCSGNFNIPTEPQIAHEHKKVDKKPSKDGVLVPLTSGLGLDEREKEDAPGQPLTDQLPLAESNSEASPLEPAYSIALTPNIKDKVSVLSSSKSSKQYKEQLLVSGQAKTVTIPARMAKQTVHSRKPIMHVTPIFDAQDDMSASKTRSAEQQAIGGKHFTGLLDKGKSLDSYRKQTQSKREQINPIALTLIPALEPTIIEHSLIAKGGHQIQLKKQDDAWIAIVREHAPVGFSRTHYLALYLAPGFTVSELSKHSTEWQENHIRVIFPEKNPSGKGYVYIGEGGLLGGGKTKSSKNKDEQNGCNFGPDARRQDPDNPSKWVCPGPGKHPRTAPPSSSSSSSGSSKSGQEQSSPSTSSASSSSNREQSPSEIEREKMIKQAYERKKQEEDRKRDLAHDQAVAIYNHDRRIDEEILSIRDKLVNKYKSTIREGIMYLGSSEEVERVQKFLKKSITKIKDLNSRFIGNEHCNSAGTKELFHQLYNSLEKVKQYYLFVNSTEAQLQQGLDMLSELSKLEEDSADNSVATEKLIAQAEEMKRQINSAINDVELYGTDPSFLMTSWEKENQQKYQLKEEGKKALIDNLKEAQDKLDKIIARYKKRIAIVKPNFKRLVEFAAQQGTQFLKEYGTELAGKVNYKVTSYKVEVRPKVKEAEVSYKELEDVFAEDASVSLEKFSTLMETVIVCLAEGVSEKEAVKLNVTWKCSKTLSIEDLDQITYNGFIEGINQAFQEDAARLNKLIEENTNCKATLEEASKFKNKLEEAIQRVRDYPTKQDKAKHLAALEGVQKDLEERIQIENHKLFVTKMNEEIDREGATTSKLLKEQAKPAVIIQEASRFKGKIEGLIQQSKSYDFNREKVVENLADIVKQIDEIIREQEENEKRPSEIIGKISEELETIEANFKKIKEQLKELNPEKTTFGEEIKKLINALKLQHETLMRKLAVLDDLAGADEETRAKRKSLVSKVSAMLDEIDRLLRESHEALEKQERRMGGHGIQSQMVGFLSYIRMYKVQPQILSIKLNQN